MRMIKITFLPLGKTIEAVPGISIQDAARIAGAYIESPCGGNGVCKKCRLDVSQIDPRASVSANDSTEFILACNTAIVGNATITICDSKTENKLKILSEGRNFQYKIDPYVEKNFSAQTETTEIFLGGHKVASESGDTSREKFGVAVDIGTTTLVVGLIDLSNGVEIASESSLNPQTIYGQDVLTRIKIGSDTDGRKKLFGAVIGEINRLIDIISSRVGIDRKKIYEAVFSGNTCMLHLSVNIDPETLGQYPYVSKIKGGEYLSSHDIGLDISPFGVIYLPPIISSYVGADITSGILASQLYSLAGTSLFVDIGTNGEMVVSRDGHLAAVSTAAGPAFEGMNIEYGMRASEGAIEMFDVSSEGDIEIYAIGGVKPTGICGSGLLDIIGELVSSGIILKNGRFIDPESDVSINELLRARLEKNGKKIKFKIAEGVYLTQNDIRQVQLAKGALRTGVEFLLRSLSISTNEVERVQIAGSFGFHLRVKSLINIGLLPGEFSGKIEFTGNTSKIGAQAFLLNKHYKTEMEKIVRAINIVELAESEDFEKVFVKSLGF